jgi:hypothetical protein
MEVDHPDWSDGHPPHGCAIGPGEPAVTVARSRLVEETVRRHFQTLLDATFTTFGKVITRGWDWLGLAPADHARITGLIEVPDLAACLMLSKSDFIRTGSRGATYLAYRKAIQEFVSRQLTQWGDRRDGEARPRMARLERDLERVLEDLSEDFPLLRALVDRRRGGQNRLPMPGRGDVRVPAPLFANVSMTDELTDVETRGSIDGRATPEVERPTPSPEPSREPATRPAAG